MRVTALAPVVAAVTIVAAGCGGGDRTGSSPDGATVFADAGCGDCHTLRAAKSSGRVGPDLDQAKPDRQKVVRQVRNGGVGMPSFRDRLSDDEIEEVARFVSGATRTATGGAPVAAQFEPDGTRLADCEGGDYRCLEQAFANLAYEAGPKRALRLFDRKIARPGPIEADCHRIAHAIGAGALSHFGGNVSKAFVAGSPSCTSGYYHGLIERAFVGVPDDLLGLASAADRMCSNEEIRRVSFILYQCVHGLGHGLMIYTGYDLPFSLRVCDELSGEWTQRSCTGGVFMENVQSSYGVRSRWLKQTDLIYPCDAVAERHKYYCYDIVPSRILPVVRYDWARAVRWCRRSERGWETTCFQGLGREASGFTRLQPARILAICEQAGDMARECVIGASRDMTYTDVGARRAKHLCNTAPASMRGYCWEGIGQILGSLATGSEQRKAMCDRVTRAFRRACYRGSGV